MRRITQLVGAIGATTFAMLGTTHVAMAGGNHGTGGGSATVLLSDLSSPKGLALDTNRDLLIAQGAFGPPGPVMFFDIHGNGWGNSGPVSEPFGLIDIAVSPADGTAWALAPVADPVDPENAPGTVHLFHQLSDGTIVDVLDITAYQAVDTDPVDIDEPANPGESNPYGLTVMPGGDALVADAAGNDIIRVAPDGSASTVARFDLQLVATDQVPAEVVPPGVLPPEIPAEAVPTTVTIGPDGAIYVGELKGFPFHTGSSHVWRIDPDASGAWCSVNGSTGGCSVYADGLTAIQDIAFDSNSGRLYVLELAADGVWAFEAGLATGEFPAGVLLELKRNGNGNAVIELAPGALSQPGGVIAAAGRVYVTDGVFTSGRLLQIKRGGQ